MLDLGNDVMKTFNDYSEEADINFGSVVITDDSPWNGKMVKDLGIPKNLLIALLIRGEENIVPKGETILQAGDKAVLISREFKDSDVSLREKVIEPTDIWPCRKLKECKGMTDGIVILIRRKDENIIPHGDTVIETGDVLVICNMKHMANNKPHSGRLGEP